MRTIPAAVYSLCQSRLTVGEDPEPALLSSKLSVLTICPGLVFPFPRASKRLYPRGFFTNIMSVSNFSPLRLYVKLLEYSLQTIKRESRPNTAVGWLSSLLMDFIHGSTTLINAMYQVPNKKMPSHICLTYNDRFLCRMAQLKSGLDHLTIEISRSYTIRHTHPVGLPRTSDQPVAQAATYTTHNRRTCMSSTGFEGAIWASERPRNYTVDRTATEIGVQWLKLTGNMSWIVLV